MNLDVSLGAALLAGAISFLSPCVLPLVPPYLVFVSGVSLDNMKETSQQRQWQRVLLAALAFVLGFTTVFVLLGATASYFGQLLRDHLSTLSVIAGVFIMAMGLHFLGVFRLALFNREARYHAPAQPASLLGAYGVGLAFAFGWTPCIGPTLAAILSVAANTQSVSTGMVLLAVYSLGLGIPFLVAGASVNTFLRFFAAFRKHLVTVERVMGAMLVLTGILFLTGSIQTASYWLLETFPALGRIG